jgi:hypothetical protein
MTRILVLLTLLSSATIIASAQSPSPAATVSEPKMLADRAMKFLGSNDIKGMFAYVHSIMPMEKSEMDKIRDTTLSQRKTFNSSIGEYVGYAIISECRKFDQVSRVIYIEKRSKNFIRWEFVFYKPKEKWQLSAFYWDNKNAEIFASC